MTDCFHCNQDDHLSYNCPDRTRPRRAPAAPWPAAGAGSGRPEVPPFSALQQWPAEKIADPRPWADSIRRQMSWSRHHVDEYLRELAARQVAESRSDPLRMARPLALL